MKSIKINLLDLKTELNEIASWDDKYCNDVRYRTIKQYVLENNIYYSLREVINLNFEQYPIGDDEKHFIHSIRNEESKLIGFIISDIFDIKTNPTLFIQYLVLHPHFHSKGYGTLALNEFITNSTKYVEHEPQEIFALIEKTNYESRALFEKFGFDFSQKENENYFKAVKKTLTLEK